MKAIVLFDPNDVDYANRIAKKYDLRSEDYMIYCVWQDIYDSVESKKKILTNFSVDIAKKISFSELINQLIEDVNNDTSIEDPKLSYKSIRLLKLERYIHFFSYSVLLHYIIIYDYIAHLKNISEIIVIDGNKKIDNNQWWQGHACKAPIYAAITVCSRCNVELLLLDNQSTVKQKSNILNVYSRVAEYVAKYTGLFVGEIYNLSKIFRQQKPTILVCNIGALREEYKATYKYDFILGEEGERYYRGVFGYIKDLIFHPKSHSSSVNKIVNFEKTNHKEDLKFSKLSKEVSLTKYNVNDYVNSWLGFVESERMSFYRGILKRTEEVISKNNVKAVIALNTSHGFTDLVFAAAKGKIPTFEIMHGIPSCKYAFIPARPSYTMCMGRADSEFTGIKSFTPIGTRKMSSHTYNNQKSKLVLYAPVRNEKRYGMNILDSNHMDYEIKDMLGIISKAFIGAGDFRINIKYGPGHPVHQYEQHNKFANEVLNLNYKIVDKKGLIGDYLKESFCVITYDSTVALESISMKVPVIFLNAKSGYYAALNTTTPGLLFANTEDELRDKFIYLQANYNKVSEAQFNILNNNYKLYANDKDFDNELSSFINKKI
jgi:hypothetical protein